MNFLFYKKISKNNQDLVLRITVYSHFWIKISLPGKGIKKGSQEAGTS